jgi:hypothetical protein
MLFWLVTAMYPQFLITLDENDEEQDVTVRVGQAVSTRSGISGVSRCFLLSSAFLFGFCLYIPSWLHAQLDLCSWIYFINLRLSLYLPLPLSLLPRLPFTMTMHLRLTLC